MEGAIYTNFKGMEAAYEVCLIGFEVFLLLSMHMHSGKREGEEET